MATKTCKDCGNHYCCDYAYSECVFCMKAHIAQLEQQVEYWKGVAGTHEQIQREFKAERNAALAQLRAIQPGSSGCHREG